MADRLGAPSGMLAKMVAEFNAGVDGRREGAFPDGRVDPPSLR